MDPITLVSTDGRTVRIRFGMYDLSESEAHDFAFDLVRASAEAANKPDHHQNHVNLLANCPLCVFEAGSQTDRLSSEDLDEEEDETLNDTNREGQPEFNGSFG